MAKSGPEKRKKSRRQGEFARFPALADDGLTLDDELLGLPKISVALYEFMRPFATEDFTKEQWQRLVLVSLVAWNAALYPDRMREELIDRVIAQKVPEDERTDAKFIIRDLVYRKEKFFSEFQQTIEECQVVKTAEGLHIRVVSSLL